MMRFLERGLVSLSNSALRDSRREALRRRVSTFYLALATGV